MAEQYDVIIVGSGAGPPNALRTATDLVELVPGQSWQGAWGIRPTSPGP